MNLILRQLEGLHEVWKMVPKGFTIGKQDFRIVLSPAIGAANFFEFYEESEWEFGMTPDDVKIARGIKAELRPMHDIIRLTSQEDIFQALLDRFPDSKACYRKYFPKYHEIAMQRAMTAFEKMFRIKTFSMEPIFDEILDFYGTRDVQNDSQSHLYPQINGEVAEKVGFDAVIPCTGNAQVDDSRFIRVFCEIQADLSPKIRKVQKELFAEGTLISRFQSKYLPLALAFRFQHRFLDTPKDKHWSLQKNRGDNDAYFDEFVHFLDELIEQGKFNTKEILKFQPSDN